MRKIFILKVSASMICAPELVPVGDSRLVIAWMPCNVPARTRYSLDDTWVRPSSSVNELTGVILPAARTYQQSCVDRQDRQLYL